MSVWPVQNVCHGNLFWKAQDKRCAIRAIGLVFPGMRRRTPSEIAHANRTGVANQGRRIFVCHTVPNRSRSRATCYVRKLWPSITRRRRELEQERSRDTNFARMQNERLYEFVLVIPTHSLTEVTMRLPRGDFCNGVCFGIAIRP